MAGAYELPVIGEGNKASQVWGFPVAPTQTDIFTPPILVQGQQSINAGLKTGTDAQDMLTAMGFDFTVHGKWLDLVGIAVLQRRMPEETGWWSWRTVYGWIVTAGAEFENIVGREMESCYYRLGMYADRYTSGQGIFRIGTS